MKADRIRVDIAESKGAPSPTAVFEDRGFDSPLRHSRRLKSAYVALRESGYDFSKIALISCAEGGIGYRGVHVKGPEEDGTPILECGRNCGNSMLAAAIVAMRHQFSGAIDNECHLRVTNKDTQLVADMEILEGDIAKGMSIDMHISSVIGRNVRGTLMNPDAMPTWSVHTNSGPVSVTTLNLVNPYIIAEAESLGIRNPDDLLSLPSDDQNVVDNLKRVREAVIEALTLKTDSEFPKIAAVHQSGRTIAARTLYLNGLHKGLPITGIISVAAASHLSGSLVSRKEPETQGHALLIRSPQEEVPLSFETNDDGSICACVIRNRYAVLKAIDVEFDLPE